MPSAEDRDPSIFVHERGDRSLDGIFRLIELAGQRRSLDDVLAAVCAGEEVVLATALAAVISHALERAEEREREQTRRGARGVARLGGVALSGGAAMGRAEILPTLAALTRAAAPPAGSGPIGTMSSVIA